MLSHFASRLKKQLTRKQFWLSNLKTLTLLAIVALAISSYQQRDMSSGQALELHGINYANGPTLVYFWGSWCPICLTTSPFVSTLAKEEAVAQQEAERNEGKPNIISIALSSGNDAEIAKYMNEYDYHFNVINDDSGKISRAWGVTVTPSIFVIDTQGDIRFISTGMTSLWGMKLRLWLASF